MSPRRVVPDNPQPNTGSPQPGEPVFLVVGKLRRSHGVKGEMSMEILTDFPQRLRRHRTVYVGEKHEPLVIDSVRRQDQAMLIAFEGLEDCDVVARLRNQLVYVQASELPALPEGEYYYHQLIDLSVVDEQGRELGVLTEILETGANDVYVVTGADGKELLLPVLENVVLGVDLEKRQIRVRPPEWS